MKKKQIGDNIKWCNIPLGLPKNTTKENRTPKAKDNMLRVTWVLIMVTLAGGWVSV